MSKKTVCDWYKPPLVWVIHVFHRFANFYQRFIQNFNPIASLLNSILKTTMVEPQIKDLLLWGKNSIIDKDSGDSKDSRANIRVKITKFKNFI